jgi:hypothetical protein
LLTIVVLYTSQQHNANEECKEGNLDECPLVRKKNPKLIVWDRDMGTKPSEGDADFVRKYYPWGEKVPTVETDNTD